MKRIIIGAAILAAALCTTSCRFIKLDDSKFGGFNDNLDIKIGDSYIAKETIKGSDKEVKKVFSDLDKIVALTIDGNAEITIKQSENTELSVELPENLQDYLKFEYGASACKIYLDKAYRYTNAKFDIVLGTSDIEYLTVNGAADIEMQRMLLRDLELEINGAGDVDMNHITCGDLTIEINGAGEIDAQEMDCKDIDLQINGAGEIDLGGNCANVDVEVNGTGSVDLTRLECSGKKNVKRSGLVSIKQ